MPLIALLLLLSACSGNPDATDGGSLDASAGAMDATVVAPTFRVDTIAGCAMGGFQTVLATAPGGIVGVATLARTETKSTCNTMNGPAEVRAWDICFAESTAGG